MIRIQLVLVFASCIYACSSNSSGARSAADAVSEAVTALPFGPKITTPDDLCIESFAFYRDLIGKDLDSERPTYTETYTLPALHSVAYKMLDPNYETGVCNNDTSVYSLFSISNYKYRLPDKDSHEIYYMTNKAKTTHDFSEAFERDCSNLVPDFYGYLIVVNKKMNSASALLIYYEDARDGTTARYFQIQNDYKINVCSRMYAEGPDGVDQVSGPTYEVSISQDGDFYVKKMSK